MRFFMRLNGKKANQNTFLKRILNILLYNIKVNVLFIDFI